MGKWINKKDKQKRPHHHRNKIQSSFAKIYPSNFGVRYTTEKISILQLSFETQSSYIYFYLFACFGFSLNTKLSEFICSKFLAIKIKRYLHVLYMQLFDYLCIHTYIHNILRYRRHKRLITYFCNLKKGIYWIRNR